MSAGGDILFHEVTEEIAEEHAQDTLTGEKGIHLWESKLGGWFREDAVTPGKETVTPDNFWGMITDGDGHIPIKGSSPFTWGCGYNLVFYLNKLGNAECPKARDFFVNQGKFLQAG